MYIRAERGECRPRHDGVPSEMERKRNGAEGVRLQLAPRAYYSEHSERSTANAMSVL